VHQFLDSAGRGQHQDPGLGLLAPHDATHLIAVHSREIPIEHQHVIAKHLGLEECRGAVGGDVDGHPLAPQAAGNRIGETTLVFGDQHAHDTREHYAQGVRTA
jgi:hypothetical protein